MSKTNLEITNTDDKHRILFIEPLGFKFGMDPGSYYTLIVDGEPPFEMYLGDSDEGFHIEFQGEVSFKLMDGEEELQSGHNLRF
jgi:hypothetical protein